MTASDPCFLSVAEAAALIAAKRLSPVELVRAYLARFAWTHRWRRQSRANPSLTPNSLLAGKMQGIPSIVGSTARQAERKRAPSQWLTSQFPTHRSREFFTPLQGIKSGDQENFRADQKMSAVAISSCNHMNVELHLYL